MVKLLSLLITIILLANFTACADLTSGRRFHEPYMVIAGTIIAGEPISRDNPIFIGRTIDVNGGNLLDLFIANATVFIEEVESEQRQQLFPVPIVIGDIFNISMGYFDPTGNFIIKPGKTYRLTAIVGVDTVWAETTVPDEFTVLENFGYIQNLSETFPQMSHSDIDRYFPIEISVGRQENKRVFIEFYCLEKWENAYYVLSDFLGSTPINAADYENPMNGAPRRMTDFGVYFPSQRDGQYIIRTPFNQLHFIFFGKYRVTVKIVDENFHTYRYKSEGFFHGGVNNGIGFFGSASRQVLFTEIVR